MVFPGYLKTPPCPPGDKPVEKIERVNKGTDANLRVTMYGSCGVYLNKGYAWSHEDGDKIVEVVDIGSRSLGTPYNAARGRFSMKIQTGYNEKRSITQPCVYYFDMNIRQTTLNDNGTYVMESSLGVTRCQILRVNVIVREAQPVCTTHLENERGTLRLSCEWIPWKSDNMELVVGNQPLPTCFYTEKDE